MRLSRTLYGLPPALRRADGEREGEDVYAMDYYTTKALGRYLQRLTPCDGTKDLETLAWLRQIQEAPLELLVGLLMESSTGSLLHFVTQLFDSGIATWTDLRQAIAREYVNPDFPRRQRDALQTLQQRASETITSYNYEFSTLVEEAYPRGVDYMEALIRDYLSGLADRVMAARVMRRNPATLADAMKWAKEEVQAGERLRPKAKPARMSAAIAVSEEKDPVVDLMRHQSDQLEHMIAALQRAQVTPPVSSKPSGKQEPAVRGGPVMDTAVAQWLAGPMEAIAQVSPSTPGAATAAGYRPPPPPTGSGYCSASRNTLVCYRCGKAGHMRRNCRVPQQQLTRVRDAEGRAKPEDYCMRCHKAGHYARECRAPPPRRPCTYCGEQHWQFDCPRNEREGTAGKPMEPKLPKSDKSSGN